MMSAKVIVYGIPLGVVACLCWLNNTTAGVDKGPCFEQLDKNWQDKQKIQVASKTRTNDIDNIQNKWKGAERLLELEKNRQDQRLCDVLSDEYDFKFYRGVITHKDKKIFPYGKEGDDWKGSNHVVIWSRGRANKHNTLRALAVRLLHRMMSERWTLTAVPAHLL